MKTAGIAPVQYCHEKTNVKLYKHIKPNSLTQYLKICPKIKQLFGKLFLLLQLVCT